MTEFFEAYRSHLIYAAIVISVVLLLNWLTNVLSRWMLKREVKRFSEAPVRRTRFIKRTIKTLWYVLGIIALSFVFVSRDKDQLLVGYFRITAYLGIVTVATIIAATLCNYWFKHKIQEKVTQDLDPTTYKFLRYLAVFVICFLGLLFCLMAFPSMKGIAQTALGGAGIIALIAGVASQEALSNLVGGLFIISFKPFKIGDVIKVTDTMVGTVTDITLRHTIIRNFENKMIVIPNAVINKERLINYDLGELKNCEHVEMGISYSSDIDLAKKILQEECEKHPLIIDNRTVLEKKEGKPIVRTALTKFNDSSITIRAWAWSAKFGDSFTLKCDVFESTKKRFDQEGIELAFPTRTIYFANENSMEKKDI